MAAASHMDISEKDLKKLNRAQLLELLIREAKRAAELEARVEELELELTKRDIEIFKSGSLAEACFKLNGVFDAARDACAMYEENLRGMQRRMEKQLVYLCRTIDENTNVLDGDEDYDEEDDWLE